MDGDCMSSGEDISSIESATENEIKEKGRRHTPAQQATLMPILSLAWWE